MSIPDAELVRQTLAGQSTAYEELVRRWTGRTLALCHLRVRSSHAAEDLTQESLLRAYKALSTLLEPAKFGPWLRGIADRVCLDYLKNKQTRQVSFGAFAPRDSTNGDGPGRGQSPIEPCAPPDEPTEQADRIADLLVEVEALREDYREVLLLYYHEDLTYDALAERLGVSKATINARLTKARAVLRTRLAPIASPSACANKSSTSK